MCHSSHYRFGTHPALWIEDLVNVCQHSAALWPYRLVFLGWFPNPVFNLCPENWKGGPGLVQEWLWKEGRPRTSWKKTTTGNHWCYQSAGKSTPKNDYQKFEEYNQGIREADFLETHGFMAIQLFQLQRCDLDFCLWGKFHSQKSFGCLIYIGDYITWLKRRDHYNAKLCCIIMYVYFDDGNPGTRDGIVFCGKKCSRLLYGISWSRSYMASGLQVLPTCHVFENIEQNIPNLTGPHDPSTALKGGKPI